MNPVRTLAEIAISVPIRLGVAIWRRTHSYRQGE